MRPVSPVLFLLMLAVLFAGTRLAPAQTTVRVLHYNIHRDIGGTGADVGAQPALARIINYLAPDVWALNELGGSGGFNSTNALNELIAFINGNLTVFGPNPQVGQDYFVYVGTQTDGFIANAIVSRYPFLATQTFSDAGGGYVALRGLVSARINLPGPVEMGVFTAHLKASSFSDTVTKSTTNAERRQAETEANAANIANWLASFPGDGAVVMGDWNETEEPGETDNWKAGSIGGVLPNGHVYQPVTTMRGTAFIDPLPLSIAGNRDTIDSASPNARFDYLFHTPSHLTRLSGSVFDTKQHSASQLAALNAANGTSLVAADSASASDHLPVIESFLVSPGPAYVAAQTSSSLGSSIATLGATINPNGFATTWQIELGTTASYGATSVAGALAASTANTGVFLKLTGLLPGTTYHYRVITQNAAGSSVGPDRTFTTTAFLDTDGDTMPNDWETAAGLNPSLAGDATLDADGDGINNRDEYAAGTDPRQASSALRIQSFTRAGANLVISWPSVFAKRYQLQTRADLNPGIWTPVQSNLIGTGGMMSATATGGAIGSTPRYYRVAVQP